MRRATHSVSKPVRAVRNRVSPIRCETCCRRGLRGDEQRRTRLPRQRKLGHLPVDGVAAASLAALDDAFLDQHMDDAVHRRAGQRRGLHDLRQAHTVFAARCEDA
jgi:hypothetical protein